MTDKLYSIGMPGIGGVASLTLAGYFSSVASRLNDNSALLGEAEDLGMQALSGSLTPPPILKGAVPKGKEVILNGLDALEGLGETHQKIGANTVWSKLASAGAWLCAGIGLICLGIAIYNAYKKDA